MEADFWRRKWRANELGWHRSTVNPMLVRHLPKLGLSNGARVFVPLCGKTRDIGWLRENGFEVAGAELVEDAVRQLFDELDLMPKISEAGPMKRYSGEGIDVFAGDLFGLDAETLGRVDAVYDRAALVALPPDVRPAYAMHVAAVTARAPQLLVTFDYDQSLLDGPPFSVSDDEVGRLYADAFEPTLVEAAQVEGGLKGVCPAIERAWTLRATV